MANLQKLPSGKWRARYRDDTGRQHAGHFDRKIDGQDWLDGVTASQVRGDYMDPRLGKVTLTEYATAWEATQVGRANTKRITDNALRLHILPTLGHLTVASLRRSDVPGLIKMKADELAPGTVRSVYDTLARVLAAAVFDRVITSTPCVKIALPENTNGEVTPPTPEQVLALVEAIAPRQRGLLVMLAGSGVRIGEALGLDVADIDFARRSVRVHQQLLQDNSIAPTKTKGSNRTVPLGQVVIDELVVHLATYPSDGPLFTNELGSRLTYRQWRPIWAATKAKAKAKVGEMDAHGLRHFCASALISGGASVKQVQTFLDHSSAAITLRVYAHLFPGDDDRTRTVMDAALSNLGDCLATVNVQEG